MRFLLVLLTIATLSAGLIGAEEDPIKKMWDKYDHEGRVFGGKDWSLLPPTDGEMDFFKALTEKDLKEIDRRRRDTNSKAFVPFLHCEASCKTSRPLYKLFKETYDKLVKRLLDEDYYAHDPLLGSQEATMEAPSHLPE